MNVALSRRVARLTSTPTFVATLLRDEIGPILAEIPDAGDFADLSKATRDFVEAAERERADGRTFGVDDAIALFGGNAAAGKSSVAAKNCGTGDGGFHAGNRCGTAGGGKKPRNKPGAEANTHPHAADAEKSKYVGAAVGKKEHVFAEKQEKAVAKALGGKQLSDNEPLDVRVPKDGGGEHAIEVKSLVKGKKQNLSVHDDALLRKVEYAGANPGTTFHTVALDHRDHYERGKHKDNYSGHGLFYRRGSGAYALSSMHRVADHDELKRLIAMPDHDLPAKARGALPSGEAVAKLRVSAGKAHASRLAKDRARKARLKAERDAGKTEGG